MIFCNEFIRTNILLLLINLLISLILVEGTSSFSYFAYGSNMLAERIHVNNPSAKRIGIGKLLDYHLDFFRFSQRWKGCVATIVPHPSNYVWGSIWELDIADQEHLDNQEGVRSQVYRPIEVNILTNETELKCRSYELVSLPEYSAVLPQDRYPSKIYLDTIINGAEESKLPEDYIAKLRAIPHNGFEAPIKSNKKKM